MWRRSYITHEYQLLTGNRLVKKYQTISCNSLIFRIRTVSLMP